MDRDNTKLWLPTGTARDSYTEHTPDQLKQLAAALGIRTPNRKERRDAKYNRKGARQLTTTINNPSRGHVPPVRPRGTHTL